MSLQSYVSHWQVLEKPDGFRGWHEPYMQVDAESHELARGRKQRLYLHEAGLISDEQVYEGFKDCVRNRNAYGFLIQSKKTGERKAVSDRSRWGDIDAYLRVLRGRIKKKLEGGKRPVMVTLSVQPQKVIDKLPENSNLLPLPWCLSWIATEITAFLKRLRSYQKRNELDWSFVGWVLEIGESGYPNIHIVFAGSWVGKIQEIAALWPWSEPQGVDVSDIGKLKRRHPEKNYTELNLANYVTKYVSKAKNAVKDGKIHKSWAWIWFFGVRMFNLSHDYKEGKKEEKEAEWWVVGRIHIETGVISYFKDFSKDSENYLEPYEESW
jgi:hypothetical protein